MIDKLLRHRCAGPRVVLWPAVAMWALVGTPGPLSFVLVIAVLSAATGRAARMLLPSAPLAQVPLAGVLAIAVMSVLAEALAHWNLLGNGHAWAWAVLFVDVLAVLALRQRGPAPLIQRDATPLTQRGAAALWPTLARWGADVHARCGWMTRTFFAASALLFAWQGVAALLTGTTVWDSVVNYVPVCVEFAQQGSFAPLSHHPQDFFQTQITSWHGTWFATIALSGSLRFLNLLGWLATGLGWLATVVLCRRLGFRRDWCLILATVVFSAPQVMVQAANTNYDQAAGFVAATAALLGVIAWQQARARAQRAEKIPGSGRAWIGFALAQAALPAVKLTGGFLVLPVLIADVVLLWLWLRRKQWRVAIGFVVVAALAGAVLLTPQMLRRMPVAGGMQVEEVRPQSLADAAGAFIARQVNMLLPYEAVRCDPRLDYGHQGSSDPDWVGRFRQAPPAWLARKMINVTPFTDAATNSLFYVFYGDFSYFGALPILLVVVALISLVPALRARVTTMRGRAALFIAIVATWLCFQTMFALIFHYTPYNGRYMLACWFLAAPLLGLLLMGLRPGVARVGLGLVMAVALFEQVDWSTHLLTRRPSMVLNRPAATHLLDGSSVLPRQGFPATSVTLARAALDRAEVSELGYDAYPIFRQYYLDDQLHRKLTYLPALPADRDIAFLTWLPTAIERDATLDERYRILRIPDDLGTVVDGQPRELALLLPHRMPAPNPAWLLHPDVMTMPAGVVSGELTISRSAGNRSTYWTAPKHSAWLGEGVPGRIEWRVSLPTARMVRLFGEVVALAADWRPRDDPDGNRVSIQLDGQEVGTRVLAAGATVTASMQIPAGDHRVAFLVPRAFHGGEVVPVCALGRIRMTAASYLELGLPHQMDAPNPTWLFHSEHQATPSGVWLKQMTVSRQAGNTENYWEAPGHGAWLGTGEDGRMEMTLVLPEAQRLNIAAEVVTLDSTWSVTATDAPRIGLRLDGVDIGASAIAMGATIQATAEFSAGTHRLEVVAPSASGVAPRPIGTLGNFRIIAVSMAAAAP